ncbi:TPA: fimbrial protein [Yersinia enterocolitica]|uniref:fimbrial protein n=1 Tax=Yersinia enterocolitica TaxID=630 RepID=UPI0032F4A4F7|nr:fimbrial protein [Yersinia enterocolitica]EKN4810480.1 fimbrial protein [Yersinia enterocolitica]HDL7329211.1 fimbrial protein [Yersinia enterocolitica]HDL7354762.1 fimbrial protein [Yersinia enterocolitica]HDL7959377.1 fimbrial protein [Yersinia enterocolitica]
MNTLKIALILLLLPWQVRSETEKLEGDIHIMLEVTAQPKIEVETPSSINLMPLISGSYNNGIYSANNIPIYITLRQQESFRVSVTQPLILTRDSGAAQEFYPAAIYLTYMVTGIGGAKRELSEMPETFNVAETTLDQNRTDYSLTRTRFLLNIYAKAPEGPDIAGQYHGQLTLLFETNS